MTWLERILATECTAHGALPGGFCHATWQAVCASRIQAAEGAAARSPVHEYGGHRGVGPWRRAMSACANCDTWVTLDGVGAAVYSRDDGATWTPGPDACPGRRP